MRWPHESTAVGDLAGRDLLHAAAHSLGEIVTAAIRAVRIDALREHLDVSRGGGNVLAPDADGGSRLRICGQGDSLPAGRPA
jgi:hypothetical protein